MTKIILKRISIYIMNLWVKRIALGLTAVTALLLVACLDEENLVGFRNQNQLVKVSFIEIPIESSVLLFDSLRTSNHFRDPVKRLLVGSYQDPIFGTATAEAYTQLAPSNVFAVKPEGAVFDSVSLILSFDLYNYGNSLTSTETFRVHELTQTLTHRNKNDYYTSSLVNYDPSILGEKSLSISKQRLDTMFNKPDTSASISIALESSFGQRLFDAWDKDSKAFTDFETFSREFKGLSIQGNGNQKIVGLSLDAKSKIVLHYHTPTTVNKDSLTYTFGFLNVVSASRLQVDRDGTDLEGLPGKYQDFLPPSNQRYIQSGSPIVTKLNLAAFNDYFNDIEGALITSAELSITEIDAPGDFDPPNILAIQVLGGNNRLKKFANIRQDSADLRTYTNNFLSLTNGLQGLRTNSINKDSIFTIMSDTQQQFAQLSYNKDKRAYKGFITLFAQELYEDEVDKITNLPKTKFTNLVLYPSNPFASKSLNRLRFNKANIKLKVYYTTPILNQ